MGLAHATVRATVAVADLDRATAFYEGTLGLTPRPGGIAAVRIYPCGGGELQVYASPGHAGASTATVASWSLDDFDATIDALRTAGVELLRYDGLDADERGVHAFGEHRVAWLQDPDGNVLALDNGSTGGM